MDEAVKYSAISQEEIEQLKSKDFIDPQDIFDYITQEEIFQYVFGFYPDTEERYLSPFREDNHPDCKFTYEEGGKLFFRDWNFYGRPIDCFDAVKIKFKTPDFPSTLRFVKNRIIIGNNGKNKIKKPYQYNLQKQKVNVEVSPLRCKYRPYIREKEDLYWGPYGITLENLIEDKTMPVLAARMAKNGKDLEFNFHRLAYLVQDFESDIARKIYSPYTPKLKFVTNCQPNDLGGTRTLPAVGKKLVITKSYKDWRVLRNSGIITCWVVSESTLPSKEIMEDLVLRFDEIIVLFDNDKTGKKYSKIFVDKINTLKENCARSVFVPEGNPDIVDPADLRKEEGQFSLNHFIKHNNLL